MNDNINLKLKLLTDSPGCYLMKCKDEIIYVGKAKKLKNRVRSYFNSSYSNSAKVVAMVNKIDDFDTILCDSNFEALNLECNLIKQYKPFYNILLKDDKQYPYIKIDKNENFPKIKLVRKRLKDNCNYFGPYLSTFVIKQLSNELSKIFPLRNCNLKFPLTYKHRPCMRYEIGLCLAPCANLCTKEEYDIIVNENINFLKGNIGLVESNLKAMMEKHSQNLEYEKAAYYRDKLKALKQISIKQTAVQRKDTKQDVWAVASNAINALAYQLNVRDGKIIGNNQYYLEGFGQESNTSILSSLLPQVYSDNNDIPKEIILSNDTDDNESLQAWLSNQYSKKIKLLVPQRGEKKSLVNICYKNSVESLSKKELMEKLQNTKALLANESLAQALNSGKTFNRIEGYDISNTQGTFSVASMVVFINGKPAKKMYRKFKINTVLGANDFASIYEVLYRRFEHGIREREELLLSSKNFEDGSFSKFPDLILIDGGKIQLDFANKAISNFDINPTIVGLAEKNEELFLTNRSNPIILNSHDPALHLIQRVRNEAHRFAIEYHRSLRDKNLIKSELLNIKGLGTKRFNQLISIFKSVESIKNASINDLVLKGKISSNLAKKIYDYYNS